MFFTLLSVLSSQFFTLFGKGAMRIPLADMDYVLKGILQNVDAYFRNNDVRDQMVMKGVIMAEQCDKHRSGSIDFDEFLVLISKIPEIDGYVKDRIFKRDGRGHMTSIGETEHNELHSETMEAFQAFDRDGSGFIDRKELANHESLEGLDEESINEMMNDADTDGDGKLSFKEFCAVMQ
jgi:Ca2+-binding EF-hand superfamily protein